LSKRVLIGLLASISTLAIGGQAFAAVEHVILKQHFDEDVIVNKVQNFFDASQAAVDTDANSFITQGAARALDGCIGDPDGLPNNGAFAKNDDHPAVHLGYSNKRSGKNARQLGAGDESFEVTLPKGKYKAIHVFATSGGSETSMKVTEHHKNISAENDITVWDWFDSEPDYGYSLTGDLDRAYDDASSCHDDNGANIWGFKFETDPSKRLRSVEMARTDSSSAVLNVFGITGIRVG
jgi:hypothetical protein